MASKAIYSVLLVIALPLIVAQQDGQGTEATETFADSNPRGNGALDALFNVSMLNIGSRNSTLKNSGAAFRVTTYSNDSSYDKANSITDQDLEQLAESLFVKDSNNANKYISLNLQNKTTRNNIADSASEPLLKVLPQALRIPTIEKVLEIYDNYKLDTRETEHITPDQREEESLLLDTFLSTEVMSVAMRFLTEKGFIDEDQIKQTLSKLWFTLYPRDKGNIGSTGFEHVFLNELKLGKKVGGLHNWIYFNAQEVAKRVDYFGYMKKLDLGQNASIVEFQVKFNNYYKPVTSMFIGTSPELEMALYTVCFFVRPNSYCPLSCGDTRFNIITWEFRYKGNDLIATAYPTF